MERNLISWRKENLALQLQKTGEMRKLFLLSKINYYAGVDGLLLL